MALLIYCICNIVRNLLVLFMEFQYKEIIHIIGEVEFVIMINVLGDVPYIIKVISYFINVEEVFMNYGPKNY